MRRIITAVVLAVGAWTMLQGPAAAAPAGIEIDVGDTGFTTAPAASLIHVSRLFPGATVSGAMGVRNTSSNRAGLSLQFVDVRSSENGCTHPERAEPGGCDPNGPGQLGAALQFTISTAANQDGPYAEAWTGSAASLERGVALPGGLGAHGTEWAQLTLSLPMSAGNDVQSDTFGFDLRVLLSGPGAPTVGAASRFGVAGVSTVRGASLGADPAAENGLAFTGVSLLLTIGGGVLLAVSGVLLAMAFRERRGSASDQ